MAGAKVLNESPSPTYCSMVNHPHHPTMAAVETLWVSNVRVHPEGLSKHTGLLPEVLVQKVLGGAREDPLKCPGHRSHWSGNPALDHCSTRNSGPGLQS